MLAAAGRDAYVLSEDRRSLLNGNWREAHADPATLAQDGFAARSFNVFHPVRFRSEHRHEVALVVQADDHDRVAACLSGLAPTYLERRNEARWQAQARPQALHAIHPPAEPRRMPVTIEQAQYTVFRRIAEA